MKPETEKRLWNLAYNSYINPATKCSSLLSVLCMYVDSLGKQEKEKKILALIPPEVPDFTEVLLDKLKTRLLVCYAIEPKFEPLRDEIAKALIQVYSQATLESKCSIIEYFTSKTPPFKLALEALYLFFNNAFPNSSLWRNEMLDFISVFIKDLPSSEILVGILVLLCEMIDTLPKFEEESENDFLRCLL
jgi:hypothetical protein